MLVVKDLEYFEKVVNWAKENDLYDDLKKNLDFLDTYAGKDKTECLLFKDFAPQSFYFLMQKDGKTWFNGSCILHSAHDNGGDGGAPTFFVCLNPDTKPHWQVHT